MTCLYYYFMLLYDVIRLEYRLEYRLKYRLEYRLDLSSNNFLSS